ncbi:MAG: metallophosphoesterase [Clostridium sp.]|uniref:metallophosphoesterase family protein n=1 Tax=Clostridium sp. TaxID=1506 RepID=UPI0025BE68F7|nr:metallophosphoesterase [Clostridium sp.]MCE5219706.1 metallophosphoesterase [Clostridium sp.]
MRFIILSDSKGKENGINQKILIKLLKESYKLTPNPECIVLCGDNVAGSNIVDILADQLQSLRNLIEKYYYGNLLIPVIGNHEVNNQPEDDRYERIFSRIYDDMLPSMYLDGYNKTVFYVDYENVRFIILNAFHFEEINRIGKKQLSWFEEAASANIKNKIVFVHSPAFPTGAHLGHCLDLYPKDRNAFWEIVENCNIDIVFSGHEHNYSRRKIEYKKGIYQVITGGSGEKLRDKFKDKKGVVIAPIPKYHFVIVDVISSGIEVSAISSKGKLLDKFKIDKF